PCPSRVIVRGGPAATRRRGACAGGFPVRTHRSSAAKAADGGSSRPHDSRPSPRDRALAALARGTASAASTESTHQIPGVCPENLSASLEAGKIGVEERAARRPGTERGGRVVTLGLLVAAASRLNHAVALGL